MKKYHQPNSHEGRVVGDPTGGSSAPHTPHR